MPSHLAARSASASNITGRIVSAGLSHLRISVSAVAVSALNKLMHMGLIVFALAVVTNSPALAEAPLAQGICVKYGPCPGALTLAALSFLYGILHAVGPGHGKTIISSYVVANEETVRRGVIISFIAAALQALTAGVLLFGLNASGLQINAWSNQLESVSYALI